MNRSFFEGKTAVVFGDSISEGYYTGPDDPSPRSVVTEPWHQLLGKKLGLNKVVNASRSGTSISRTSSVLPEIALSLRYAGETSEADIVFVEEGTNDFGTDVPLGKPSDTEDVSFYGACDVLCRGLKEKYPDALIVVLTPIERYDKTVNALGLTLDCYRSALTVTAAGRYGFTVIEGSVLDLHTESPAARRERFRDGVHPDPEAHAALCDAVCKALFS